MAKLSMALPKFTFFREVYAELRNVTWPRPRKVAAFTALVILCVIGFSYFISLVDAGFLAGLKGLRTLVGTETVTEQPSFLPTGASVTDENGNPIDINSLIQQQISNPITTTTDNPNQ